MTDENKNQKDSHHLNISGSGNVIGVAQQGEHNRARARVDIRQDASASESLQSADALFALLDERVAALSDDYERKLASVSVEGLKAETAKGENAEEAVLAKRLQAIRATLSDVFEVVVATIANPAAGFALVAQKIAKKVRSEADQPE